MLLEPEELTSYKIPGLPELNIQQARFFVAVMKGTEPKQAWLDNYYDGTQNIETAGSRASILMKSKWYTGYKEYYLKVHEQRTLNEAAWNIELSILERKKLYSLNMLEVERLAGAHDKAIAYWTKKKEQAMDNDDEQKVEYYEQKIIKEIKSKNMAIASNQACQAALEGLDKLMGLQTVNVNHTGEVNFVSGDDLWAD